MSTTRNAIARTISNRKEIIPQLESAENIFGQNVFGDEAQQVWLPTGVYKALRETKHNRVALDPSIADSVANGMKNWAMSKGVSHFTHWFQPLTGGTAEKHDAFIDRAKDGSAIFSFSGQALIRGEPDASSFPSGGLRQTFQARGYTAWDATSDAFIQGNTLYIPTVFYSYTGEALDTKVPLLRSQQALSRSATRLLHILGDTSVEKVYTTAALEQEYFVIDAEYYNNRPDLIKSGRTLFGAPPAKGQELDDHYFGSIKQRTLNFMQDCEQELYKLGIFVKTRHNEVAPSQFEVAHIYEDANLTVDHNHLIMATLEETAKKHNLRVLLHEKPFAGLNGSGKHCNWSITDSNGKNLVDPGADPKSNMRFMLFLACVIKALDDYAPLLRISVASAGNDHRLGANEAPPAVITAFIGEDLLKIVEELITGKPSGHGDGPTIQLGVDTIPEIPRDNTDRNRTSPFAFTGNKFEFRALGASQSASSPNFTLNAAVAAACDAVADRLEQKTNGNSATNDDVISVITDVFKEHRRIIFNEDGYAEDFEAQAEKLGLPNLKTTVDAVAEYSRPEFVALFEKYGVMSERELRSRQMMRFEKYITIIGIEAKTTLNIARTMILPAAMSFQQKLCDSINAVSQVAGSVSTEQKQHVANLSAKIDKLIKASTALEGYIGAEENDDVIEHAKFTKSEVIPAMNAVREAADSLETLVDDALWPMPKYFEMIFVS